MSGGPGIRTNNNTINVPSDEEIKTEAQAKNNNVEIASEEIEIDPDIDGGDNYSDNYEDDYEFEWDFHKYC